MSAYDAWRLMEVVSSYRVPKAKLPLTHPGKACSEDVSLSGEDGSHGPDAFMWC